MLPSPDDEPEDSELSREQPSLAPGAMGDEKALSTSEGRPTGLLSSQDANPAIGSTVPNPITHAPGITASAIGGNTPVTGAGTGVPEAMTLPKIVKFDSLARCGGEIWIENEGQIYRLRKTRQGKLILTK